MHGVLACFASLDVQKAPCTVIDVCFFNMFCFPDVQKALCTASDQSVSLDVQKALCTVTYPAVQEESCTYRVSRGVNF